MSIRDKYWRIGKTGVCVKRQASDHSVGDHGISCGNDISDTHKWWIQSAFNIDLSQ
jgi:hypothetical protein